MKLRWLALLLLVNVGCSSLLYHPSSQLFYDPKKLNIDPEDVWIQVEDNRQVHAWYFKNTLGVPAKTLTVFFHGNGQNLTSHYASYLWVLKQGHDFVIFDYAGYGLSPGTPSPENTVKDGVKVIEWAHKRAPNAPLWVLGQSLGGAIATRAVIECHGSVPIARLTVDSTFASYKHVGRAVLASRWLTWPFQWLSYLVLSDEWAPYKHMSQLAPVPFFVIHGDDDRVVPFSQGEEVFDLAPGPREFCRAPGGSHIDSFWKEKSACRERYNEMLKRVSAP